MSQLEIAFTRTIEKKNRKKILKSNLRQILDDTPGYNDVEEKLEQLRLKKKEILTQVAENYPEIANELESIKAHLKNDQEMLSDLAVNKLLEGETVTVADPNDPTIIYEPTFKVSFKKVDRE